MEDEVFYDYFEKLLIQVNNFSIAMEKQDDKKVKEYQNKIKQILEEIENDSFRKGKTFKLKEEEFMSHFKEI